jgi:hypothetical protein
MRPWQKYILGEITERDFLDSLETIKDYSDRDKILDRLTKADVVTYRWMGRIKTGVYTKEPIGYRAELRKVYNKLDFPDLVILLKAKEKVNNQR